MGGRGLIIGCIFFGLQVDGPITGELISGRGGGELINGSLR